MQSAVYADISTRMVNQNRQRPINGKNLYWVGMGVIFAIFLLIPGAILTSQGYSSSTNYKDEKSNSAVLVVGPMLLGLSSTLFIISFVLCICGHAPKTTTTTTMTTMATPGPDMSPPPYPGSVEGQVFLYPPQYTSRCLSHTHTGYSNQQLPPAYDDLVKK